MRTPRAAYQAAADRAITRAETHQRYRLSAGQHILHLLLTICTCGLWLPVWIVRATRGNPAPPAP